MEYAASFTKREYCSSFMKQILSAQVQVSLLEDRPMEDGLEFFEERFQDYLDDGEPVQMPQPELENLEEIAEYIRQITPYKREEMVMVMLKEGYIHSFLDLFDQCEEKNHIDGLHHLFNIFRELVGHNEQPMMDCLLSNDNILRVVGVLEYDPSVSIEDRTRHREFLIEQAKLVQVVPFNNPTVVAKIHENFHLQYIKDVILGPTFIEEGPYATLNQTMFCNNAEILNHVKGDERFLAEIVNILNPVIVPYTSFISPWKHVAAFTESSPNNAHTPEQLASCTPHPDHKFLVLSPETHEFNAINENNEKTALIIKYIEEWCSLARNFQPAMRGPFYKSLIEHGLLQYFSRLLVHPDDVIRMATTEILSCFLLHDANIVREHLLSNSEKERGYDFFKTIQWVFLNDHNLGLKSQMCDVLQAVLEVERTDNPQMLDKTQILNVFYEHLSKALIEPLDDVRFCDGLDEDEDQDDDQQMEESNSNGNSNSDNNNSSSSSSGSGADVMDTESINKTKKKKKKFNFRKKSMLSEHEKEELELDIAVKQHLCDLIGFILQVHRYRARYFLLGKEAPIKVLRLLKHRHRAVALAAIRCTRAFLTTVDFFYDRFFLKNDLFKPLVDTLARNGSKYNLLNSSILDIFHFIVQANRTHHIVEIGSKYQKQLEKIQYVSTFQEIMKRYEQHKDGPPALEIALAQQNEMDIQGGGNGIHRMGHGGDWEEDDEYFNEVDDDEEDGKQGNSGIMDGLSALAGYGEDDDEGSNDNQENTVPGTSSSSSSLEEEEEEFRLPVRKEKGKRDGAGGVFGGKSDTPRPGGKKKKRASLVVEDMGDTVRGMLMENVEGNEEDEDEGEDDMQVAVGSRKRSLDEMSQDGDVDRKEEEDRMSVSSVELEDDEEAGQAGMEHDGERKKARREE
eukprot:TRINITY_DN1430_c0_g1_i11.p1 TRINITY_DN1430_c0_g1~~TRINITY_DN1430_c0_g1_i11.p1  ORF type:complete len:908 (+),score=340.12 TRINITY_DN1430_c0_g1_i11:554-3277(+)